MEVQFELDPFYPRDSADARWWVWFFDKIIGWGANPYRKDEVCEALEISGEFAAGVDYGLWLAGAIVRPWERVRDART